jgi:hypothetical protein
MKHKLLLLAAGLCLLFQTALSCRADPANGIYRLMTRGQQNMSLDVEGWGNSNGTHVSLYTANHTSNQQWLVERQSDGTYKLSAFSGRNSMQVLDNAGGNLTNGNSVTTWEDYGGDNQRWYFQSIGGGWYRIIPKAGGSASGQTLEILGGASAGLGSRTDIWQYLGGDNQVFKFMYPGPSKLLVNSKKGIGGRERQVPALGASWYYTWGGSKPSDGPSPAVAEFVPMQWGYYPTGNPQDDINYINYIKSQPGVQNLLAFNEPDNSTQSNLDVNTALDGYQYLAASGMRIGSPACTDDNNQWMSDFMQGVSDRNYRMDFLCVHCYIRDPQQFLNYVDNLHNRYWWLPMWITEFAPADWSGNNPVSDAEAQSFMQIVVPGLNSRWYVERYAWYSGSSPGPWTLGSAGLVNDNGTLTAIGRLYSRM